MVADRVRDLTGGGVRPLTLRVVVAARMAAGLALGTVRVVTGVRLEYLLALLVLLILLLSLRAPRPLVALAYDTGPMATSIVTVPLITATRSASGAPAIARAGWVERTLRPARSAPRLPARERRDREASPDACPRAGSRRSAADPTACG